MVCFCLSALELAVADQDPSRNGPSVVLELVRLELAHRHWSRLLVYGFHACLHGKRRQRYFEARELAQEPEHGENGLYGEFAGWLLSVSRHRRPAGRCLVYR